MVMERKEPASRVMWNHESEEMSMRPSVATS